MYKKCTRNSRKKINKSQHKIATLESINSKNNTFKLNYGVNNIKLCI